MPLLFSKSHDKVKNVRTKIIRLGEDRERWDEKDRIRLALEEETLREHLNDVLSRI